MRLLLTLLAGLPALTLALSAAMPAFELVQPEVFAASGAQPNAWADYDGDGDLDLFAGFKQDEANRLYRNDNGKFTNVAAAVGVADVMDTRAASWGDFDADGDADLFVGFTRKSNSAARLYRNEGRGRPFTEVASSVGLEVIGEIRQPSFVDYDGDGDLDLFVAVRDAPNLLFRNDGARFVSVGKELGIADPRRTVGAVWFDMDTDGDLDVFVANQNGDLNGMFRNDGATFVDVGAALGMDAAGRAPTSGSNGPSVADFDRDGDLDLFVASYGPNFLYRNDGPGKFTEVAAQVGVAGGALATPSRWGDIDNDGWIDLYVSSYVDKPVNERDFLFHNLKGRFEDILAALKLPHGATHGIQWVDYDADGDLDFSIANNNPTGTHALYRNQLAADATTGSVAVHVVDQGLRATRPGAEIRVYAAGTRTLLGMGIVDSGGGYCSQNVMPVHIGIGEAERIDIEVTVLVGGKRAISRRDAIEPHAGVVERMRTP